MRTFLISFILIFAFLGGSQTSKAELAKYETRHYTLYTDLGSDMAGRIGKRMDAMYNEYSARMVDFGTADRSNRCVLMVFAKQADFLTTLGEERSSLLGLYVPKLNAVLTYVGDHNMAEVFQTLQHEAFHQFAANYINMELPIWLNEGLAEVFGESLWTGSTFQMGQATPGRISYLQELHQRGSLIGVRQLMTMTHDEWHQWTDDPANINIAYTQSWAMAHFLIFGEERNGVPAYRSYFLLMLRYIHQGYTPDQAFGKAFAGDYDGFESRFRAWIPSIKPAPLSVAVENQQIIGAVLAHIATKGGRPRDLDGLKLMMKTFGPSLIWRGSPLPSNTDGFFRDATGRYLNGSDIYFETGPGGPIPNLVYRYSANVVLRTRFVGSSEKMEADLSIESN